MLWRSADASLMWPAEPSVSDAFYVPPADVPELLDSSLGPGHEWQNTVAIVLIVQTRDETTVLPIASIN